MNELDVRCSFLLAFLHARVEQLRTDPKTWIEITGVFLEPKDYNDLVIYYGHDFYLLFGYPIFSHTKTHIGYNPIRTLTLSEIAFRAYQKDARCSFPYTPIHYPIALKIYLQSNEFISTKGENDAK